VSLKNNVRVQACFAFNKPAAAAAAGLTAADLPGCLTLPFAQPSASLPLQTVNVFVKHPVVVEYRAIKSGRNSGGAYCSVRVVPRS
jgi:hypothetical protein